MQPHILLLTQAPPRSSIRDFGGCCDFRWQKPGRAELSILQQADPPEASETVPYTQIWLQKYVITENCFDFKISDFNLSSDTCCQWTCGFNRWSSVNSCPHLPCLLNELKAQEDHPWRSSWRRCWEDSSAPGVCLLFPISEDLAYSSWWLKY